MTITSGIAGNIQYNANNLLIFSKGNPDASFSPTTTGTTVPFNNVVYNGPSPATSLDTSTGIFTCNYPGTYIIWACPDFYNVSFSASLGFTGSIYVNGALYQTSNSGSTLQAWNGNSGFMNVTFATMLYVTTPGTTFYFVVQTTVNSSWTIQGGNRGDVLYIA